MSNTKPMAAIAGTVVLLGLGNLAGLTKSDWASWIQAAASMLAVWLGFELFRRETKQTKERLLFERTHRLNTLLEALQMMLAAENELLQLPRHDNDVKVRDARHHALMRFAAARTIIEKFGYLDAGNAAEFRIPLDYSRAFDMVHTHTSTLANPKPEWDVVTDSQWATATEAVRDHRRQVAEMAAMAQRTIEEIRRHHGV